LIFATREEQAGQFNVKKILLDDGEEAPKRCAASGALQ
jgi:hypothetical protein